MGYSCAAKAAFVLDALQVIAPSVDGTSNGLPNGGFWEQGQENADGAITGTVFKPYPGKPGYTRKAGGFKISADGKIERFPGLNKAQKAAAEALGAKRYVKTYPISFTVMS